MSDDLYLDTANLFDYKHKSLHVLTINVCLSVPVVLKMSNGLKISKTGKEILFDASLEKCRQCHCGCIVIIVKIYLVCIVCPVA